MAVKVTLYHLFLLGLRVPTYIRTYHTPSLYFFQHNREIKEQKCEETIDLITSK